MDLSIIIPVKDEAGNLASLAQEVDAALKDQGWQWECVWVDDGSTDGSLDIIKGLHEAAPHHRYLSFGENAGQSAALLAGFEAARGGIIATLDGDGQNDPADLPAMVELILAGSADMVNGYRAKRRDSGLRKIASKIANGARNAFTGKTVRDVGCSTRAFRAVCVQGLPGFVNMHRFFPTLVAVRGYRLAELPVNHRPRSHGISKYTINNRLWVGLLDLFGVWWLNKRVIRYRICDKS